MKTKILIAALLIIGVVSCKNRDEMELNKIIKESQEYLQPLNKEAALAYWMGTTTGDGSYFDKYSELNIKISNFYSDSSLFSKLKTISERGKIQEPALQRQLEILYNNTLSNQVEKSLIEEIINKTSALEQKYASFRANLRGKRVSDNEIERVLQNSTDNSELKDAWLAHKEIGVLVSQDIIELVKLRNRVAVELGFQNYHSMSLTLSGQDPNEVSALFDELDSLTKDSFDSVKDEMDEIFAKRYEVNKSLLMPWHYQGRFFQESPQIYPVDLDSYYKGRDIAEISAKFYESIGLETRGVIANSDLFEREGKNQHAYCIDIDTKGDVRVLVNLSDTEQWMGTMLHELGHAVYSLGHSYEELPYFLRNAAHPFTTEAVAMIFGRLSRNPEWMEKMLDIEKSEIEKIKENCRKSLVLQQLVFSRWAQVMYRFEREMYNNPDGDLNTLWWELVSKYQKLTKPADRDMPDWATKIHVALYPCYYHNYQLGELLASQMHYYIVDNITKSGNHIYDPYINNHEVGKWMKESIFVHGMRYNWNEMIEKATGERLSAKYYAMQFVTTK